MPEDISLLPEELRKKEEELKKAPPTPPTPENLRMYVPKAEEEDIEVIEVDEGEIGEILEGEPLLSRVLFKTQSFFQEVSASLFHPRQMEPPPKLPPQFFKAPPVVPGTGKKITPGLVPIAGAPVAMPSVTPGKPEIAKSKARVMPSSETPRRVRVIRRIRKPVRVSFLDEGGMRGQIDVPRRRFTLIIMAVLFIMLLGGGYWLMLWQGDRAQRNLNDVKAQLAGLQAKNKERQASWDAYRDLEPRLKALSRLLDGHLSPSKVFDALELNTVPEVSYSSFTLSPDGHVILSTTAPSFDAAARQIVAFQKSGLVTKVQAMGYQATYGSDTGKLESVGFQVSLTLDPAVLQASKPLPTPVAAR